MKRIAATLCLALTAVACNSVDGALESARVSGESNSGICPNAFAINDAARKIEFAGTPSLDTVAWSAEIVAVRTSCRYVEDKPIKARVEIDFAVGRGPAATADTHELAYFVAVTRRNRDLIAKESFTVPVRLRNGVATATLTEELSEILIPRANAGVSGGNFEIAVGLQLTREQVLYNRSGQSLKFPGL